MDMEKCSWEFNESVAEDFDNHVSASVPGYEWFHEYIVKMAGFYIEDDDAILDIGCSTGTLLRDIKRSLRNRDFYMTGVDKSSSMIDIAKSNVHDIKANFFTGDILEFFDITDPSVKLSFITIVLTLQFLSYEDRFNVLKTCYSRLKDGGAVVVVEKKDAESLAQQVAALAAELRDELATKDPDVKVTAKKLIDTAETITCATPEDIKRVAAFLQATPNGVQAMSADMPGLVQTSLNLGILKADAEVLRAEYSVRSSVESEKDNLIAKLSALVELAGGDYVVTGDYPGWKYRVHSPLREKMVKLYAEMYGNEPRVEAIHAGLECGLLGSKISDLDCVSMGPDMKDIHTTEETLSISSTKRVWEYLVRVLETKD